MEDLHEIFYSQMETEPARPNGSKQQMAEAIRNIRMAMSTPACKLWEWQLAGQVAPHMGWGFLESQLGIKLNTVNALQELHCACASIKLNVKAAVLKMA